MADPKHAVKKGSGRVYQIEGAEYPSVTSILDHLPKPALPRWAAKMAAEYAVTRIDEWYDPHQQTVTPEDAIKLIKSAPFKQRDQKANLGTLIHEALEAYLGGKSDDEIVNTLDKNQVGYFYGVLHFLDSVEPQVLATESTVVSKKYGYAGTADIIALVDGYRTVIDLKTSKACYTSHGAQCAAYARAEWIVKDDALKEFGGAERGMVVIVNDDGEFKAHPFNDLDKWFNLFLAAQAVWEKRDLKVPEPLRV